jgi:hypothetical protein
MSDHWAVSVPLDRSTEAFRLWNRTGVEVCETSDRFWLRGTTWDEALDREFRSILGSERYSLDDEGLITPLGRSLPVAELPAGNWTPLTQWFRLTLPPRRFVARPSDHAPITLEPSNTPQEANLLVASLANWIAYVDSAPAVRLKQWSFAVCEDLRVAVRGLPLPPLPGCLFVEHQGIAVPAGWRWSPPLSADTLREAYNLKASDVILLTSDGTCEKIESDDFVSATRSAVRLTAKEFA